MGGATIHSIIRFHLFSVFRYPLGNLLWSPFYRCAWTRTGSFIRDYGDGAHEPLVEVAALVGESKWKGFEEGIGKDKSDYRRRSPGTSEGLGFMQRSERLSFRLDRGE